MIPDDSGTLAGTSPLMNKAPLLAILLTILTLSRIATACELRVRVPEDNSYAPFYIRDSSGTWSGLSIELTEALLAETACTPVYVPLPFSRAIQSLKTGAIDLMPNMSITEERREFVSFIGPQLDETVLLVTRADTPLAVASLEDFKKLPKPVGIDRGKLYGDAFERKRRLDPDFSSRLEEAGNVNFSARKLSLARLSGFLGYGYNVMHQIRTNPLYRDFAVHPFIVNQDWVYFGLSKQSVSPKLLTTLQNAYEVAKRKGRFEKIRGKYLLERE
ncbi:MAG: amino acid ABC transporter substrate-binding protein [Desulfobulbaceae bacterium]|nr:MAG: amino acid ABC transporter substrate-binding protein [Desulfobulbaceae bacterium]